MTNSTFRQSIQEHKGTAMINLFGSIIPIIMFLVYATNVVNDLATTSDVTMAVRTHMEASMHPLGQAAIERVEYKSECRWLDDKIDRLDDLIYQLESEGADPDRIHDKEQELRKYQNKYRAKNCDNINY